MAFATKLEICNGALVRLGLPTITSLSGTDKASKTCNARIQPAKRAVLRAHDWNFARVRTKLTTLTGQKSISGITQASPGVFTTSTAHGFSDGDWVGIADVAGMTEVNGIKGAVTNSTSTTFELTSALDTSSYSAWTSAGIVYSAPRFNFTYQHTLPTDALRLLWINFDEYNPYKVEGRNVLSEWQELEIVYTTDYDIDTGNVDQGFAEALSAYLAWDMAYSLTQDLGLKNMAWDDWVAISRSAKFTNSTENSQQSITADDWWDVRFGTRTRGFVRDPMTS